MKRIIVRSKTYRNGFITYINGKRIITQYPKPAWNSFPKTLRESFANTASYFFTHHMAFAKQIAIDYAFPPPPLLSFYFYGLLLSLPSSIGEIPQAHFTMDYLLKHLTNSEYAIKFTGIPKKTVTIRPFKPKKYLSLLPMSFGKDSLLTYAVLRELHIPNIPIFIEEPTCPIQNRKKLTLGKQLAKTSKTPVLNFPVPLGKLRDKGGLLWGWDMLLTQYTFLFLPFVYYYMPEYFFWSNEQSTNETYQEHGFTVNPTHEQGASWTLNLNNVFREYGADTKIASILEPLQEFAITYILHHRYPDIGALQLSCDSEQKRTRRWCEDCYECARIYIFLKAIGIDPKTAGFETDMLKKGKKSLYDIFPPNSTKIHPLGTLAKYQSERLLSFYLAYKRGVKGDIITLFKRKFLRYVENHKHELFDGYFKLYPVRTIPEELQKKILPLYQRELAKMKKDLCKFL